ncbi:Uncharacterised protein [Burkholderia pseudomallei]|nr:Uncharacterised protein [Burkholderia pseudomallei]
MRLPCLKPLVAVLVAAAASGVCSTAFSQMSLADQQQEAQRLKTLCQNDREVAQQREAAAGGSMRAAYLGTAALIQCYYDNVDSRYPPEQKAQWLDAINANRQKAAELGQ